MIGVGGAGFSSFARGLRSRPRRARVCAPRPSFWSALLTHQAPALIPNERPLSTMIMRVKKRTDPSSSVVVLFDGGEAGAAVLSALDCGGGGGDRTSATRARPLFFGLRPSSRPLAHTHTQTPLDHHPFSLSRHTRTLSSPSRQAAAIEETRLVQTSESPPFRALSVSSPFPRTRAPTTHTDQREPTP